MERLDPPHEEVRALPRTAWVAESIATMVVAFAVYFATAFLRTPGASVVVALATVIAMKSCARVSGGYLNPLLSIASADDRVTPDDAVRLVVAQLLGGALAGLVVGVLGVDVLAEPSSSALWPELLVAASSVVIGLSFRSSWSAGCVAVTASIVGAPWLGNPALVIGAACAQLSQGSIVNVSDLLALQLFGALAGMIIALQLGERAPQLFSESR